MNALITVTGPTLPVVLSEELELAHDFARASSRLGARRISQGPSRRSRAVCRHFMCVCQRHIAGGVAAIEPGNVGLAVAPDVSQCALDVGLRIALLLRPTAESLAHAVQGLVGLLGRHHPL
jgi:hypothetical protein